MRQTLSALCPSLSPIPFPGVSAPVPALEAPSSAVAQAARWRTYRANAHSRCPYYLVARDKQKGEHCPELVRQHKRVTRVQKGDTEHRRVTENPFVGPRLTHVSKPIRRASPQKSDNQKGDREPIRRASPQLLQGPIRRASPQKGGNPKGDREPIRRASPQLLQGPIRRASPQKGDNPKGDREPIRRASPHSRKQTPIRRASPQKSDKQKG